MLPGAYRCDNCSFTLPIEPELTIAACPHCGAEGLQRASIFGLAGPAAVESEDFSDLIGTARAEVDAGTRSLALRKGDELELIALECGHHRLGRGIAVELRLDDPTVSRHHALLAVDQAGVTIYDDRSTNGVFVNGERVEEAELRDGDDIMIGRYHLHLIDAVQRRDPALASATA